MAQTQRCEVNEVQLRVGSRWTDSLGNEFIVDAVGNNGAETWVAYYRKDTNMHYRCLAEAFTYRFRRIENESR